MAIAFDQDDVGTPGDGGTLAFSSNVSSGSLLLACAGVQGGGAVARIVAITDSLGNTWAEAVSTTIGVGSPVANFQTAEIWYAYTAAGGANTLTFDWNGILNVPEVNISAWTGFSTAVTLDATAVRRSTVAASTFNHGEITMSTTPSLSVAVSRGTSTLSESAVGDSFSSLTQQTRTRRHFKILSATETHDCDETFNASEIAVGVIANWYPVLGGGGGGEATIRHPAVRVFGVGAV